MLPLPGKELLFRERPSSSFLPVVTSRNSTAFGEPFCSIFCKSPEGLPPTISLVIRQALFSATNGYFVFTSPTGRIFVFPPEVLLQLDLCMLPRRSPSSPSACPPVEVLSVLLFGNDSFLRNPDPPASWLWFYHDLAIFLSPSCALTLSGVNPDAFPLLRATSPFAWHSLVNYTLMSPLLKESFGVKYSNSSLPVTFFCDQTALFCVICCVLALWGLCLQPPHSRTRV